MMLYARFPLSLRNAEDLLFERGIDICHETVRHRWNRFGRHSQTNGASTLPTLSVLANSSSSFLDFLLIDLRYGAQTG